MITLRRQAPRCHVTTEHNGVRAGLHHCQTHATRWYGTPDACPDQEPPRPSLWARLAPSRDAAALLAIGLLGAVVIVLATVLLLLTVAAIGGAL